MAMYGNLHVKYSAFFPALETQDIEVLKSLLSFYPISQQEYSKLLKEFTELPYEIKCLLQTSVQSTIPTKERFEEFDAKLQGNAWQVKKKRPERQLTKAPWKTKGIALKMVGSSLNGQAVYNKGRNNNFKSKGKTIEATVKPNVESNPLQIIKNIEGSANKMLCETTNKYKKADLVEKRNVIAKDKIENKCNSRNPIKQLKSVEIQTEETAYFRRQKNKEILDKAIKEAYLLSLKRTQSNEEILKGPKISTSRISYNKPLLDTKLDLHLIEQSYIDQRPREASITLRTLHELPKHSNERPSTAVQKAKTVLSKYVGKVTTDKKVNKFVDEDNGDEEYVEETRIQPIGSDIRPSTQIGPRSVSTEGLKKPYKYLRRNIVSTSRINSAHRKLIANSKEKSQIISVKNCSIRAAAVTCRLKCKGKSSRNLKGVKHKPLFKFERKAKRVKPLHPLSSVGTLKIKTFK